MVSPGNPTRASSAIVAARTFSTTWWLRGPRCTPLVRRVELSIATTLARMASECCHLDSGALLHVGQAASERTRVVDGAGGGLGGIHVGLLVGGFLRWGRSADDRLGECFLDTVGRSGFQRFGDELG